MALFEQVKEVIVRELAVPESQVTEEATFDGDLEGGFAGCGRVSHGSGG